ncbi:MAG: hypothetical protein IPQ07_40545 [Myxococcales bacterium]|nr:hypothetical protein [Myxococcales bacterium]
MAFDQYQDRRSGGINGDIILGIILIVVGIAITAITHDHASQKGGTYVVAFGPIVVGVIRLFRGLARAGG